MANDEEEEEEEEEELARMRSNEEHELRERNW
jgi:hypothetical protein